VTGPRIVHDISQTLSQAVPTWPGDTAFQATSVWEIGPGCPVNVAKVTLSTHTGSHADAPLHYDPAGAAIADIPLDAYVGPARVVDLRGKGPVVTAEVLERPLADTPPRVLLRTFEAFPHDRWPAAFVTIDPSAVRLMAERGVILVGTDAPSVDPEASKSLDAHNAVREAGLLILEGLVLDGVAPGDYELIALPLKLAGLDASPVRAVLRELQQ
jgi:arylformamidase